VSPLFLVALALALALDAFAVSVAVGVGLERLEGRSVFRLSFHIGLFHAIMPVLGWLAGSSVRRAVSSFDHWVAFGLLAVLGGKMIFDAFFGKEDRTRKDPTRGLSLLAICVATTIDAFAVGLSLAMLEAGILLPAAAIGGVSAVLTAAGLLFGRTLGAWFGRGAEAAGGAVLLAIGIRILTDHLSG